MVSARCNRGSGSGLGIHGWIVGSHTVRTARRRAELACSTTTGLQSQSWRSVVFRARKPGRVTEQGCIRWQSTAVPREGDSIETRPIGANTLGANKTQYKDVEKSAACGTDVRRRLFDKTPNRPVCRSHGPRIAGKIV